MDPAEDTVRRRAKFLAEVDTVLLEWSGLRSEAINDQESLRAEAAVVRSYLRVLERRIDVRTGQVRDIDEHVKELMHRAVEARDGTR